MIIDIIEGHKVERYDSIEEMPIARYMNFNRFVMMDSGIGSDLESIDEHDRKLIQFAKKGKTKEIIQEVSNRNQNMRFILENINMRHLSYAVTVKSIDGQGVYDYSDEGCKKRVELFTKWSATKGFLEGVVSNLVKKLEGEIDTYFPHKLDNPETKDIYSKRKKRVMLICQQIRKEPVATKIKEIEDVLLNLIRPTKYTGHDGMEVSYVRAFEDMSFVLSQHTSQNPKLMTVIEYYQAWEVVKRQMKSKKTNATG